MRVGREMGMDSEREQPYNSATRVISIPFLLNVCVRCMHLVQRMAWNGITWFSPAPASVPGRTPAPPRPAPAP